MSDTEDLLSPAARYRDGVTAHRWENDPAQAAALDAFDALHRALLDWKPPANGLVGKFRSLLGESAARAPRGLYLWGQVGRGKTFLMDLFVASLPTGMALRRHFHHFMGEVHEALRTLQHKSDPLPEVAAGIARRARVLCLDEFLVDDIGDAMILTGLLRGLVAHNVVLVTTSNTPPGNLYRDGLQRARFLPAIALLERHCRVLELDSAHDWRLRALHQAAIYQTPPGAEARRALTRIFDDYARGDVHEDDHLDIHGRPIAVHRRADNIGWFDFDALCDGPRSRADYTVLADRYPAVIVSDVPIFTPDNHDPAKRFIHLVDALYDCRVKLVLSAAAPIVELYEGDRLRAEFARTESRLIEMQSEEYLGLPHAGEGQGQGARGE
ncbi:MAG TPA: cell division protein ZapE [Oleiagrimonas sp.]|nr:cell division protein ZapE [Oleiagrimonas sp.]